jgi:hypothetical protein
MCQRGRERAVLAIAVERGEAGLGTTAMSALRALAPKSRKVRRMS